MGTIKDLFTVFELAHHNWTPDEAVLVAALTIVIFVAAI